MQILSVNIERTMDKAIGDCGVTQELMDALAPKLEEARVAVMRAAGSGWLEWTDLPSADPSQFLDYAKAVRPHIDAVVVIGIGGSALGTTALATALLPFYYNERSRQDRGGNPKLYVLDNVDPDETFDLLSRLDLKRTLVNVISKSGTTGESMSSYLVFRQRLEALAGRRSSRTYSCSRPTPPRAYSVGWALLWESGCSMFLPESAVVSRCCRPSVSCRLPSWGWMWRNSSGEPKKWNLG